MVRESDADKASSSDPAPNYPVPGAGHDRANEPMEIELDMDM